MSDAMPSDAPVWQKAWREFQDPYLGPDTQKFPSPFESFVSGFIAGRASVTPPTEPALREWADHELGDGTAPPEENFWDDRTTPLASSEHEGEGVRWGPATTA